MITIKKSATADTRSAKEPVSKETLLASSYQHISDVHQAINWMQSELIDRAIHHDWTKIKSIDEFHRDFVDVQQNPGKDFCRLGWYQRHITEERHHLDKRVPDDVDLFDVMERIADIVMAGMGRSGSVYPDHLSPELLCRAYQNTIDKLKSQIKVEE